MVTYSNPQSLMAEIGKKIARHRLNKNITQASLAKDAGIALRTLRRLEAGKTSSMDTFLRVLIFLGLDDALVHVFPLNDTIRPIERMKYGDKLRQRARPKPKKPGASTWSWGEGH